MITHQYNLNKGTLIDTHGNTTVESNTSFDRKEKGLTLYCNGTNAKFELGDIGNVKSLAFVVNLKSTTEQIFEGDPNDHLIYANVGMLTYPDFDNAFVDGVDTNTITTGWHLVIITSTIDVACSDAVLALNNTDYGNLWCSKIIVYDHELSLKERANLLRDFNQASPISKSVPIPLTYPKPTTNDDPTCVAHYNFISSPGGILTDLAGTNNGVIYGAVSSRDDLKFFSAHNNKVVLGNIGNIKSIAFRIKLDPAGEKIMEGAANDKLIHISGGILTYPDFDNAFIDGTDDDSISTGKWTTVVIVSSTDINFSACTLALNNTTYSDFEISDLQFFSDEKDLAWAVEYNNEYVKRISYLEEFKGYGVGSTL